MTAEPLREELTVTLTAAETRFLARLCQDATEQFLESFNDEQKALLHLIARKFAEAGEAWITALIHRHGRVAAAAICKEIAEKCPSADGFTLGEPAT